MRIEKYILWLIALALGIKFFLFLHIACVDSLSIMQPDSFGYLLEAKTWMHYFSMPSEGLRQDLYRTPGYPLFLAVFHDGLNLPLLSIVFLQIVLNVLTAVVVFKTISWKDRRIGLLSTAIVLLDLPTTIYSTMILTESLHVFILSLGLYAFVKYINNRRLAWLAGAAIFLGASVYVRPVGYFLGFVVAGFVLYLWGMKKFFTGLAHAIAVLVLVYGFLGIWQYHNLKVYNDFTFCSINHTTIDLNGIIGRYARETNPQFKAMPPALYYADTVGRNFLNLMTTPGNMKYFHSSAWKIFGVIFGYLFVIFWWVGWILGMGQCKRDAVGQFLFLVLLYFIFVSLFSTGWLVTPRFRVPMVPSLAILAAWGWMALLCGKKEEKKK